MQDETAGETDPPEEIQDYDPLFLLRELANEGYWDGVQMDDGQPYVCLYGPRSEDLTIWLARPLDEALEEGGGVVIDGLTGDRRPR